MMIRNHPSQDKTASSPRPSLIRRLREVTTELGWRRTLAIGPRWLVSRRYLVFVSDLRAPQPGSIPPAELRVTLLRDLDPAALAALTAAMVPDDAARRLREGQWCLLGWWGADLVHCRWESDRPTYLPYLARVVRPLPGDLLVASIWTAPRYRGRGVASAVMMAGVERARAAGYARLVWLTAWWNTPSLGLVPKVAGPRLVGTVESRGLGRARRWLATGDAHLDPDGSVVVRLGPAHRVDTETREASW